MDIILKGVSISDLQYLRGALEARIFKVRISMDQTLSGFKFDSEVDSKDYYDSCKSLLCDELSSLNGLLDML